jgi:hypothetical protein
VQRLRPIRFFKSRCGMARKLDCNSASCMRPSFPVSMKSTHTEIVVEYRQHPASAHVLFHLVLLSFKGHILSDGLGATRRESSIVL